MSETINMKEVNEAISSIEFHTKLYRKRRITTKQFQEVVTQQLLRLDAKRDYMEYLRNMGQSAPAAR